MSHTKPLCCPHIFSSIEGIIISIVLIILMQLNPAVAPRIGKLNQV